MRVSPVPTEYLFIDGGCLRDWYIRVMQNFYGTADIKDIDFNSVRTDCGSAEKVFYYDCIGDIKKGSESDAEFASRVKAQEDFFNSIRSFPGYHVILGSMTRNRKMHGKNKWTFTSP